MKFLLNMNLPRALGRMLAPAGHEWRHAGDIGMARASDVNILAADLISLYHRAVLRSVVN